MHNKYLISYIFYNKITYIISLNEFSHNFRLKQYRRFDIPIVRCICSTHIFRDVISANLISAHVVPTYMFINKI